MEWSWVSFGLGFLAGAGAGVLFAIYACNIRGI